MSWIPKTRMLFDFGRVYVRELTECKLGDEFDLKDPSGRYLCAFDILESNKIELGMPISLSSDQPPVKTITPSNDSSNLFIRV